MYRHVPHLARGDVDHHARPFPILDRAFDAVERTLARLGVEDPASLRSPRPVEDALSNTALPQGTLLVLNPGELRAAEVDVEETVKDERSGGSVYVSMPPPEELQNRRRSFREMAAVCTTFGLTTEESLPPGFGRLKAVEIPESLADYRFLLADTPGFRVAVIRRALPGGGEAALWTGNPQIIDEVGEVLRRLAAGAGHEVPNAAPEVPALEGVNSERDVWQQASDLRAYRVIREAELREIARQAALKGVAMRREREAKKRAAG